jgi:hypothetical protein
MPLPTCGSSYRPGLQTRDSKSTLLEILESGRNHTVATMVLLLLRASWDTTQVFWPITVSACRYFLEKNDAIRHRTATGVYINLKVLGIGDGLTVRCSDMHRCSTRH